MRITNKIMQSNSLSNINTNKLLQDKLNTQIATQKKISRPSDDPVVAIRELRLNTNLSEISQYYEKNVPDADNWLTITETALNNVTGVLKNMYAQCQKGADGTLASTDRLKILENLKGYKTEVYSTGDADVAGRTVFTGYRTDTSLTFQADTTQQYSITEQLKKNSIDTINYVETGTLSGVNETNYNSGTATTEQEVSSSQVHRIRLAYDDLTNASVTPALSYNAGTVAVPVINTITVNTMSANAVPSPYTEINLAANAGIAIFVPETGELLLGSTVYNTLQGLSADSEIRATYEKTSWSEGDLRPEHYFACTTDSNVPANSVVYNSEYLTGAMDANKQVISYDVGYNQNIRVNTLANECFTQAIGRDVDELMKASQAVVDIQSVITKLKSMVDNTSYDQTEVQERLTAATKSETLLKDKEQKLYAAGMTAMTAHSDKANLAITNVGSRSARLDLIKNRLSTQQTSVKALAKENSGIDVTEVAVQLSSASLSYDAALMATGKIVKNSLLDFI